MLEEKVKQIRNQPHDANAIALHDNITLNPYAKGVDLFSTVNSTDIKFTNVTHKELYKSNIYKIPGFHHSQIKWVETLNTPVVWEEVWKRVHNFLSTNEDISFIWEQIHLNFYTQYSYNKWHRKQQTFPLCGEIPKNIYHIILYCDVVVKLWRDLDSLLLKLCSVPISDSEKAFGIVTEKPTSGILIRNWLTYKMRRSNRSKGKHVLQILM